MVRVAVPPAAMVVGVKVFVTVGARYTSRLAVAAAALFPPVVCSALAAMVFVDVPAVLEVTFTATVQPAAGIEVPLAIVKLPAPAVAVTPVQVPVLPAVPMVMPAGKVSVSAAVSVSALALVLPIVTVRSALPPLAIAGALNDLVIVGAASTVSV